MATLFPVGDIACHVPSPSDDTKKWSYRDLQRAVGGTFELLFPLHRLDCRQVLVVNEEGAIRKLPVNAEASDLWRTWGGQDQLRGPVLLIKLSEIE
jgi:hypothetical protein